MVDIKDRKIVVTGGRGFVGSHIVDTLNKLGAKVEVAKGDILDTGLMREVFTGAFAVIHQAGKPPISLSVKDPIESHKANVSGALSVLVAARDAGVDRVIYASSVTVYGKNPASPKDETLIPEPCSPYAVQKLEVELNARLFYDLYGLKTVGLRYSNVYGPGQEYSAEYVPVIARFVDMMKNSKRPQVFGDGKRIKDFVYIDDVVEANILALKMEDGFGEVYNIGSGVSTPLNKLIEMMNEMMGISIEPEYFEVRAGDSPDVIVDISKASRVLQYAPKVSLEDGLKRTIESYK